MLWLSSFLRGSVDAVSGELKGCRWFSEAILFQIQIARNLTVHGSRTPFHPCNSRQPGGFPFTLQPLRQLPGPARFRFSPPPKNRSLQPAKAGLASTTLLRTPHGGGW